jgi:hypothetical protein
MDSEGESTLAGWFGLIRHPNWFRESADSWFDFFAVCRVSAGRRYALRLRTGYFEALAIAIRLAPEREGIDLSGNCQLTRETSALVVPLTVQWKP